MSLHVSIHATLAGGDGLKITPHAKPGKFLSTPPSRVATRAGAGRLQRRLRFYPRHPRGWRLDLVADNGDRAYVSIHATLAGGDRSRRQGCRASCRFYPRHPRGWRHFMKLHEFQKESFLSTPPSRVATTTSPCAVPRSCTFLSTPPSRVATTGGSASVHQWQSFLSTPPSRVATCLCLFLYLYISTFLSTPPSRVATWLQELRMRAAWVSIHATLAGGDCDCNRDTGSSRVSIHATLAGGDLQRHSPARRSNGVSIHATLAGGD